MQTTSIRVIFRWIPVLLWGLVILVLSLMPGGPGNMNLFGIPHFDKVGHFGMYAIWTFLIFRAFSLSSNRSTKSWLLISVLLGVTMGIILEVGQLVMHQGRSFELADMFANALGAGIGACIGRFYFPRK